MQLNLFYAIYLCIQLSRSLNCFALSKLSPETVHLFINFTYLYQYFITIFFYFQCVSIGAKKYPLNNIQYNSRHLQVSKPTLENFIDSTYLTNDENSTQINMGNNLDGAKYSEADNSCEDNSLSESDITSLMSDFNCSNYDSESAEELESLETDDDIDS